MKEKIVGLGMSGGVDSAVSAYLLKKDGYKVIGLTMKLIDDTSSNNAINDAKKVCDFLGIEHFVIDLQNEFKNVVIKDFIESLKKGITPNPCVVCNKFFKFGLFYEKAKEFGCNYIATGHYAKIIDNKIYCSDVADKDQSYFLYAINKEIIKNIIFPLQNFKSKEEIRKIAKDANLLINQKKDSQDICFIQNGKHKKFIDDNVVETPKPGDIVLEDGTFLGKHNGLMYYTVGQRKGLNISYKEALYVLKLDYAENKIIVGPNESLFNDVLVAKNINLLVGELNGEIYAKVRSRGKLKKCEIEFLDNNSIKVKLYEKERAITKGQSVVFYNKNGCCLGGGIID